MFRAEGAVVVNEANRARWQSLVGFHHEFWFWHRCDAGNKNDGMLPLLHQVDRYIARRIRRC